MFIVIMPLLLQALLQFFHMPGVIKYTVDVAWVAATFGMLNTKKLSISRKLRPFVVFVALFCAYCIIAYVFNYQSVFYFLWGFRNNFRFYFAFFAIAMFLEADDLKTIFKFLDVLFVINILLSLYQFFVLKLMTDFCGGIFGTETGSNGSSLLLFSVVVAKSLLNYMNGNEKAAVCGAKCVSTLLLAAIAEIKFYFIVFVIILIVSGIITRFSAKKMVLAIGAVLLLSMTASLYQFLFEEELSITSLMEHFSYDHYASAEDVGRFSAIPRIMKIIHQDWLSRLFGMGLGNCDTSSFAICNTPFFRSHQRMNYMWFSSACWFLETGFVGLFSYLTFFVISINKGIKLIRQNSGNPLYAQVSVVIAVLCILLTFYNGSLRTDIGYLAFFALALPFVGNQEHTSNVYAHHRG